MMLPKFRLFLCAVILTLPLSACSWWNSSPSPILPDMPDSMKHSGGGSASFSSSSALSGEVGPRTMYNGEEVSSVKVNDLNSGMMFPDGNGGVIWMQGEKYQKQNAGYVDARELKLKVRELAEQLVAGMRDNSLQGTVALPVSFVNLDNLNESSSFGR